MYVLVFHFSPHALHLTYQSEVVHFLVPLLIIYHFIHCLSLLGWFASWALHFLGLLFYPPKANFLIISAVHETYIPWSVTDKYVILGFVVQLLHRLQK